MLVVALTGGIGAGKSTVAELLRARGAVIVDTDLLARQVVEPGGPAYAAVVERFGSSILQADGALDRDALAKVAFSDPAARADLEAITHPAIHVEVVRLIGTAADDAVVVVDIPLLVESMRGGSRPYGRVIVVEAPRELRLERLARRGVSRADAEARMAHQASDEERRAAATWILRNDGDRVDLEGQVDRLWVELAGLDHPAG